MMTPVLFALTSLVIAGAWNRWGSPRVAWGHVALFLALTAGYLAPTLFTSRVDLPARLAYVAYPWKGLDGTPVRANTGTLFAQVAPWTDVAREILLSGEMPLWNRHAASGAPLLANQQTALFHPFTLVGLALPLGKLFTLSAALRLFTLLFFTFVFLRQWELRVSSALFGAIAYTFSSFHVVMLLFPLGLAAVMLPPALVAATAFVRAPRISRFLLLTVMLALAVLGGHPETAMWVWIAVAAYVTYLVASSTRRIAVLAAAAGAFVLAMMLTAWFWLPTLAALRQTERFHVAHVADANPTDHGLTYEWLLPLLGPNILGKPQDGSYQPPRGSHPAILNDYGEVCCGYAGLLTLGLLLGLLVPRRPARAETLTGSRRARLVPFFAFLLLFALLTITEAPVWRDLVRAVPLAGISLLSRLRLFWVLGVVVLAAAALDRINEWRVWIAMRTGLALAGVAFLAMYALRKPHLLLSAEVLVPVAALGAVFITTIVRPQKTAVVASIAVVADLWLATWQYNPAARPADVYPVTPAIARMQQGEQPYRMAAMGWSFLADTPSAYRLDDVKTTDPVANARYLRLFRGYLFTDGYDQVIGSTTQPFFDYLNVRYVYAPPGAQVKDGELVPVYEGRDGRVLENRGVLPRYFIVPSFLAEPSYDTAVARSKLITNFRDTALVDHIPEKVARQAPELARGGPTRTNGGHVQVVRYGPAESVLDVASDGWNLLVSSDVHWPGWRAYWKGQRQPPVYVNGAFLGVFVPPGNGRLVFRYRPDEYVRGLRIAGAGLLIGLLLGGVAIAARRSTGAL